MSTTPKPQTPTADLVAALAELDNVKANKVNSGFKNRYVSLDALLDAVKPILFKHNLALIQTLVSQEGKIGVSTAFLHASGERFEFGTLLMKADALTAQQVGGLITYARRMSVSTSCGISVDVDDDGAKASNPPARMEVWYDFIPSETLKLKAKEYLVSKGWLADAHSLKELSNEHQLVIAENQAAFLKAISK